MLAESTDDPARWKRKYYASLDELERKEARWAEVEKALQQALSRLSLAAYGLEAAVDGRLDHLREALRQRSEAERVADLADQVHQAAVRAQGAAKAATPLAPPAVLRDLLAALTVPEKLRGKHRRLVEKLAAADDDADADRLVRDVAALLGTALATGADAPGPQGKERKGLLGRILASDGEGPGAEGGGEGGPALARLAEGVAAHSGRLGDLDALAREARAVAEPAALERLVDDLAQRLCAALDGPGSAVGPGTAGQDPGEGPGDPGEPRTIESVLDALLRAMDLPLEATPAREALQARLEGPLEATELEKVLEAIAGLVGTVREQIERERDEMHRFLAALTDRLGAIDGFMASTDETRVAAIDASRELHESVSAEVGELRSVARDAVDLDQIRQLVEARVDTVERQLTSFLRAAEERDRHSSDEIGRLADELETTRSEADDLRERLDQARSLALRDGLTGVYNRAALEDRLDSEEARWRRYGGELSLLMWDVDRFKALNDRFGHLAGDKVLKAVAQILDRTTRDADFVARYGGEEFVVLLPSTGEQDALITAEKLRAAIEAAGFRYRGEAVSVTASCGISALREGSGARDALRRADAALYAAKAAGRNRVLVADADAGPDQA